MATARRLAHLLSPVVETEETHLDAPAAALLDEEAVLIESAVASRRAEFTTVRDCARRALNRLGGPVGPILPGPHREPQWPVGIIGSLTHCHSYRAAAVAWDTDLSSLGIDAEVHEPLPLGVAAMVMNQTERQMLSVLNTHIPSICWDRLLFSAKESIFKAWFPLTQSWLDFTDCELTIDAEKKSFRGQLLVPVPVHCRKALQYFHGQWTVVGSHVLTAVEVPAVSNHTKSISNTELREHPEPEKRKVPDMTVTREQAIQDVADILYIEPSELDPSADLLDQGMDSVRIMSLIERWRSAGVTEIDFIALAEDQRLNNWLEILASLQR